MIHINHIWPEFVHIFPCSAEMSGGNCSKRHHLWEAKITCSFFGTVFGLRFFFQQKIHRVSNAQKGRISSDFFQKPNWRSFGSGILSTQGWWTAEMLDVGFDSWETMRRNHLFFWSSLMSICYLHPELIPNDVSHFSIFFLLHDQDIHEDIRKTPKCKSWMFPLESFNVFTGVLWIRLVERLDVLWQHLGWTGRFTSWFLVGWSSTSTEPPPEIPRTVAEVWLNKKGFSLSVWTSVNMIHDVLCRLPWFF